MQRRRRVVVSGLDAIAVTVDGTTGNVGPLIHEIRHALIRLLATEGESAVDECAHGLNEFARHANSVIDLRSLPLAPGEEEEIEALLGIGEVRADITALGPTTVQETRVSGVWIVTHRNADDEVVAKFIEVTRIPPLLLAHDEDIRHGVEFLNKALQVDS